MIANAQHYLLLVSLITVVCCRNSPQTGSNQRIRHSSGQEEDTDSNVFSDSNILARLQTDILNNLGMSELPTPTNQLPVPDYARQLALEEASSDQPETHFMEKSSHLLLIAKKVQTEHFGETIRFVVNAEDRNSRLSEAKLYYYLSASNITISADSANDKLLLRLSLLKEGEHGKIRSVPIKSLEIHRHLIGWHSLQIPIDLISQLLTDDSIPPESNSTINFQLTCLNCNNYQAFPDTITKENVPFLKINSRRRRTRRNGANRCSTGSCCPRELIVDFQAMGWDWVLFPKRYTANYCAGTCSNSPADRATMSSQTHIIDAMLNYMRSGRASSCCVPASEEFLENFTYVDQTGNIRTSSKTIRTIHSCKCT